MTAGERLNKRVWRLFDRAAFETRPNEHDPAEQAITLEDGRSRTVDILAEDSALGVKIIGENTTSKRLGESFSTYVHDLQSLMLRDHASAGLLVYTNFRPTPQDVDLARASNIQVWGNDELRYYESLVDTIGEWAKREIIHSFGIQTAEERNTHTVLAIRCEQPFTGSRANLFMFCVTPEILLKTAVVFRRAQGNAEAYQRMLRKTRLTSVTRFVTQPDAILPPNVIVHLSNRVTIDEITLPTVAVDDRALVFARDHDYSLVRINIPMEYASLEIIDGQHRLFGFIDAEPATRRTFNLVVLGLTGLGDRQRRDTFVAINDNSRRMDANLVAFLKHTTNETECQADPELMAIRLIVLLSDSRPFQGKIRLLDVGSQKITLKGFAGYDLKGMLGPRGLLRKHYEHKSEEYVKVLQLYFSVLKSLFREQWKDPVTYIIFTNRGISAFLKLLKSILRAVNGPVNKTQIEKYLKPLTEWSDSHWEIASLKSAYVGSKGWSDFHRDLVTKIRRRHPGFKE